MTLLHTLRDWFFPSQRQFATARAARQTRNLLRPGATRR